MSQHAAPERTVGATGAGVRLFGFDPALLTGMLGALVSVVVALGVPLSTSQVGYINAAIAAVVALIIAVQVHPFPVPVLTGFLGALFDVALAFGWNGDPAVLGAINAAIVAIFAMFTRTQVVPKARLR